MFVKSNKILTSSSPVFTTISNWYSEQVSKSVSDGKKVPVWITNLMKTGVVIGFNKDDFINESCYKGFCKLYRCNSDKPKFMKKYFPKPLGIVSLLGFKNTDYDGSLNYLFVSKMGFLKIIKDKMMEEFPEYPAHLYLGDKDVPYDYKYNREWEHIKGLTPQEKIVLANSHNEEPFPNSLYENDRGIFSKRTQSNEHTIRLEVELSEISDVREYEANETDDAFDIMEKTIMEREMSFQQIREGFDYGDFQEFSDIYTRTQTAYEDYELYPIRVNCMPKAVKKRGKSPYDTKLGVREWRWVNNYQRAIPLDRWKRMVNYKPKRIPKYNWEMTEDEQLMDEYNLPDNFWEEIEEAYRNR